VRRRLWRPYLVVLLYNHLTGRPTPWLFSSPQLAEVEHDYERLYRDYQKAREYYKVSPKGFHCLWQGSRASSPDDDAPLQQRADRRPIPYSFFLSSSPLSSLAFYPLQEVEGHLQAASQQYLREKAGFQQRLAAERLASEELRGHLESERAARQAPLSVVPTSLPKTIPNFCFNGIKSVHTVGPGITFACFSAGLLCFAQPRPATRPVDVGPTFFLSTPQPQPCGVVLRSAD
jgi:hypothetical protein